MSTDDFGGLDPRNSILFVGSGFSMDATQSRNHKFLDGKGLANHLADALGDDLDDADPVELQDISDDFLPDRLALLCKTLRPLKISARLSANRGGASIQPIMTM